MDANVSQNGEQTNGAELQPYTPPKLPTIDELYADKDLAASNNRLSVLLNQTPPESWLKYHPIIKVDGLDANGIKVKMPLRYLPIQRVEWLLTSIYQRWKVEVKEVKQIANAVVVTVTLHVMNPLTGEWESHDGVGAMDIQTKAGASPAELQSITSGAIPKAAPAAKSYAIKDAAECLGKLFGKDLSRADVVGYQNLTDKLENKPLND